MCGNQIYGDEPSLDGCPVAEGELESMVTGNTFIGLKKYYEQVAIRTNIACGYCCISGCRVYQYLPKYISFFLCLPPAAHQRTQFDDSYR